MYACLPEPRAQAGGIDNIGKITHDGSRYYYLKDHLGSIRAIVNQDIELVSAQDGACPAFIAGIAGLQLYESSTRRGLPHVR
jgi:DNA polymerase II small subunit/DNA polymerase delta subunit B